MRPWAILRRRGRFAAGFARFAIRIWSSARRRRRRGCGRRPSSFPSALFLALPERRVGLQIIHQELRGLERRLPVRRGRQHQHDVFAWRDAADAMDHGEPGQRPARHRGLGMARDLGLRHSGIMFERQRRDRARRPRCRGRCRRNVTTAPISVRPSVSAAISRPMSKSASWMRMVTAAAMNGSAAGHRRKERDLAGAGDRRHPDLTWAWSIAARITCGVSKA